jgi:PIN domain nuclease of toxin-antitoxin system
LLLDTHLLLWALAAPERLGPRLAAEIEAADRVLFSVASVWEVAIKFALGRPDFAVDPRMFREALLGSGWRELAVTGPHVVGVADLPALHADPFDRLLVAQARVENLPLLTRDPAVAAYPGPVRLV